MSGINRYPKIEPLFYGFYDKTPKSVIMEIARSLAMRLACDDVTNAHEILIDEKIKVSQ